MKNTVGVVIPFYQREKGILKKCVDSIINQNFKGEFDVCIVDDGSPVPARDEIPESYYNKYNINIISQENSGPAVARNTGLDNLSKSCEYIAFMDSDDWWDPSFIEIAVSTMNKGFDLFFVNTKREGIDGDRFGWHKSTGLDFNINNHNLIDKDKKIYEFKGDFFDYSILRSNILATSSTIFRKSRGSEIRFNKELFNGQDRLFKIHLSKNVRRVAFSPEFLVSEGAGVNIYDSSKWGADKSINLAANYIRLSKAILSEVELSPKQNENIYNKLHQSRFDFCASFLHLIKNSRGSIDWSIVKNAVKDDPVVLFKMFPSLARIILTKLNKSIST
ncbi:MAG: glycosyltransferase family 2 protein [Motiliproteus sp.]